MEKHRLKQLFFLQQSSEQWSRMPSTRLGVRAHRRLWREKLEALELTKKTSFGCSAWKHLSASYSIYVLVL